MFNIKTSQCLFRATYRDTSGTVSKLFFMSPSLIFGKFEEMSPNQVEDKVEDEQVEALFKDEKLKQENDVNEGGCENRFIDDEVVEDDDFEGLSIAGGILGGGIGSLSGAFALGGPQSTLASLGGSGM